MKKGEVLIYSFLTSFLLAGLNFTYEESNKDKYLPFKKDAVPYKEVKITVVYDNYSIEPDLKSAWGFSCLIQETEKTILFDTGGDGQILLFNMQKLGINPDKIDIVVLSHIHSDHTGGLDLFLARNPKIKICFPSSFPWGFKQKAAEMGARIFGIKEPSKICRGIYSIGEMGRRIKEQSLLINTEKGLVIITGCAHPGIVNIIKKAREIIKSNIYLVLGGFHLSEAGSHQIESIIREFKQEGVEKVAPCHCSGELTRRFFQEAYREDFIIAGVGKKIKIKTFSGE